MENDKLAERVATALSPLNLVIYVEDGTIIEVYAFFDRGRADEKADEIRNHPDFNDVYEYVEVIYNVPVK